MSQHVSAETLPFAAPELPSEFRFPEHARAWKSEKVVRRLWSDSERARWMGYRYPLHVMTLFGRGVEGEPPVRVPRLSGRLGLSRWLPRTSRQPVHGSVLVVGECQRKSEIRQMTQVVSALIRRGETILYLVRSDSAEAHAIREVADAQARPGQIRFVDPWSRSFLSRSLVVALRSEIGARDVEPLAEVLKECGSFLSKPVWSGIRHVTTLKAQWLLVKNRLEFDQVIVRNVHPPLSLEVALEGLARGKPVVTFQHGVFALTSLFLPVLATRKACFGRQSAKSLRDFDAKFAEECGTPIHCQDYFPAGSFFDRLVKLPANRRTPKVVLVIDQESGAEGTLTFFGIRPSLDQLAASTEELLRTCPSIERVIVRPHPNNVDPKNWRALVSRFPGRVELTPASRSLDEDIAASGVAVGLFSGALATAAAAGLPSFFLWDPEWFYTPDLACFAEWFTTPDRLPGRIDLLLSDPDAYRVGVERAKATASEYYHECTECAYDDAFFERLLSSPSNGS